MKNFLPYAKHSLDESDMRAVNEALLSPILTRGPYVEKFEKELASYVGSEFAVCFSSGSTALTAAFQAASLSEEDVVVSTPNTFIATLASAKQSGASIKLVDIDTYGNIDLERALEVFHKPRTRGRTFFVPVHFAGMPVDMPAFYENIAKEEAFIIEDAAHALGSSYSDGSRVGSCLYSDMTIFSFHPAKNITSAEGGAVTCNSLELYTRLKKIRDSGREKEQVRHAAPSLSYYEVHELSSNYHMSDLHAALGSSQLKRIDQFHQKKMKLWERYLKKLQPLPGIVPLHGEIVPEHHMHLFVLQIAFHAFGITRDELILKLIERGIGTQYHYVPLYYHDALGLNIEKMKKKCPIMENYYKTALSLPFFSSMEESEVDFVVDTLYEILVKSK
jgi:dTDP-4-amino-4,6-dideoxygalactose transaminase